MTSSVRPPVTQPVTRRDPVQIPEMNESVGSGADAAQRRAADPGASAWVGASAGTGKTKVLTDRVMRLLLPRSDGSPGTPPHKILCLTYTKAAAGEMSLRISAVLGRWAVMDDPALEGALAALTGQAPTPVMRAAARQLFARVVDAPGGLKIMTLHSFCKSVLSRFPLEAGILPGFRVLADGEADLLFSESLESVLREADGAPTSPLGAALSYLAGVQDEGLLRASLRGLCAERLQLRTALTRHFGVEGVYTALCAHLGHDPVQTPDTLLEDACREAAFDLEGLRAAAAVLGRVKGVKAAQTAARLAAWCAAGDGSRAGHFADHEDVFFTHDGVLRKQIYPKEIERTQPDIARILDVEAARLERVREAVRAARCAGATRALLHLGVAVLEAYEAAKVRCAALDYEDLILRTLGLLDGAGMGLSRAQMVPWVMYKLDQGLDHILIDEAQDTNPEQWRIVEALADDFFSGSGAREEVVRTLFTVGDEKQSIYSFQRAAPDRFAAMRALFSEKIAEAGARMEQVALDMSFRSTSAVLDLVDAVFDDPEARKGLGAQNDSIHHRAHRVGQAGLVRLWPVFASPDKEIEADDPWSPPVTVRDGLTGAARAAAFVASEIAGWIEGGALLASHNRSVQAGDILILVRTRTAFVNQLVRALKTRGVPVTGVDRMILTDQLAVQDLLAVAQFALLPEDDLTLACVLKSPLIGLDEEGLYNLAQGRSGRLWEALQEKESNKPNESPVLAWLRDVIRRVGSARPYEFFTSVLHTPCPADPQGSGLRAIRGRLGEDVLDPLDELLNACLAYENVEIPSVQGFVHWIARDAPEIKRELEEAQGRVRIMTVHGSKGLQAPLVILPDTLRAGAPKRGRILWPDKSGLPVPVWSARREDDPAPYRAAADRIAAREEEEYRRLLYVALTRAEDRLYVTGFRGTRAASGEGWYDLISRGFERLQNVEFEETSEGIIQTYATPQTAAPDRSPKQIVAEALTPLPQWLFGPPEPEPDPPRPLVPTRPSDIEPAAASPLAAGDPHRFRRGILTHRLLQFLPDLGCEAREHAAFTYLERQGGDLPETIRGGIAREVLAILNDPAYADLFGPGSMAEVPVTGLVGGRIVSAQIDRLVVTPSGIQVVDFKTNRPPPQDEKDIPQIYRAQMRAYRDALCLVWPDRPVRCFLLWTDGPRMMEVIL